MATTLTPREIVLEMARVSHAQQDCLLDMDLARRCGDHIELDRLLDVHLGYSRQLLGYQAELAIMRRAERDG